MPELVTTRLAAQIERMTGEYSGEVDITIYNAYKSAGSLVYQRTQIIADMWSNRKAVNIIQSGGNIEADAATVIISSQRVDNENYVNATAWVALASKTGKWTLQNGDFVVRGHVTDEITGAFTATSLKAKYEEVLKITSVDIRNLGDVKHWKVGLK
jgi:hypothetical protein